MQSSSEEKGLRDNNGQKGLVKLIKKAEELRIPLIGEPPNKNLEGSKCRKCEHPEHLGPEGIWDYAVIKELVNLEEEVFICE